MSAFYLDILKDRLYTSGTDSRLRRAAQTVLYEILVGMLKLMSPILCFTASEAWDSLKRRDQKAELAGSIFFEDFPALKSSHVLSEQAEARWNRLMAIRSEITKALENARTEKVIGHPLEAEVLIAAEGEVNSFLVDQWELVKEISIVSEMTGVESDQFGDLAVYVSEEVEGLRIAVNPAAGGKCERCWTRSESVGENSDHPEICSRCSGVLDTMKFQ